MSKAINWPAPYRDTLLSENTDDIYCAFRLGTLYYDGQYWTPDEPVDIRCNHLKVRKGVVYGELIKTSIGQLTDEILKHQKPDLRSCDAIHEFFKTHYDVATTDDTDITVVFYKNQPLDENYMDNPDPSGRFV